MVMVYSRGEVKLFCFSLLSILRLLLIGKGAFYFLGSSIWLLESEDAAASWTRRGARRYGVRTGFVWRIQYFGFFFAQ